MKGRYALLDNFEDPVRIHICAYCSELLSRQLYLESAQGTLVAMMTNLGHLTIHCVNMIKNTALPYLSGQTL